MRQWFHRIRQCFWSLLLALSIAGGMLASPLPTHAQVAAPPASIEVGATLAGRIVDDQGRGVAGVTVVALPSRMSAVTDADGFYRIAYVPRGPNVVVPLAPVGGQFFTPPARAIWVRTTQNDGLNFVHSASAPPMLIVGGRTLDRDGHGLAGIRVTCGRRTTISRTDGWYVCPPQRLTAPVTVEPRPNAPMRTEPPSYAFDAPRTVVDADFVLTPIASTLHGRIVNAQQHGMPGIAVHVHVRTRTAPTPVTHTVVTDADGRFAIEVPPGARIEVIPQAAGLVPSRRALIASAQMPEAFFRQASR